MKQMLWLSILLLMCLSAVATVQAQWTCQYATYDASNNGIGNNIPGVGVISEDMFIGLAADYANSCNFFVPYVHADSALGRVTWHGYAPDCEGYYETWSDGGFDQVLFNRAFCLKAMPDSFIYVANNDANHNILVFKWINDGGKDTIEVVPVNGVFPRQETGSKTIYAIDVDKNGYVYVCIDTSAGETADIKIYPPLKQWTASHTDPPVRTIDLPDGIYKGMTVSPDGKQLFVSDFKNRKVLKYTGSPTTGYTAATGFNFALGPGDTAAAGAQLPVPQGMAYMTPNNILFVVVDGWPVVSTARSYDYGRIVLLNPNTGAKVSADTNVSVINQAYWNFKLLGSYTGRGDGTVSGRASAYTSTMDVKLDQKGNVYTQSYNGWTVDKWVYSGTLPTFTGVQEIGQGIPENYRLSQNYPNPFNPSTQIEFSVPKTGQVSLRIYNVLGQDVATLVDGETTAGTYRVTFDASTLPSGTYFYALHAGTYSAVRKMMVLK